MTTPVTWFQWANWIEAGLWILIGGGFLAVAVMEGRGWKTRVFVAVVLMLFGISDLIEAQTGAWYRPAGLLVWKGLCVACLLGAVGMHLTNRRRNNGKDGKSAEPGGGL